MIPWVFTALVLSLAAERPVELISHRGESADAPENTLAAFELAWERSIPAIELDVHLTKDGRLICCHDADTKRTTGDAKQIKECTLAELCELDAGQWKDARFAGEKLPTLEAALATIPDGARCFIEVKVGPEAVPALEKAVLECGKKPAQLAVISFNAATIAAAKQRLPHLKMFYLSGFKKDKATGAWLTSIDDILQKAKEIGADGVDLAWDGPWEKSTVSKIRKASLEFYVWTVDDPAVARKFVAWGVDGITTNKADWMRRALSDKSPRAK